MLIKGCIVRTVQQYDVENFDPPEVPQEYHNPWHRLLWWYLRK
jgi:hypothetical protein